MSWDKGFNFRATSGYVTDGTGESPVLAEAFPHTYGNSASAGWSAGSLTTRDRNSGTDRRLAGIQFVTSPDQGIFEVTLPAAGVYNISLALGDYSNQNDTYIDIVDNTTVLWNIAAQTVPGQHFIDATNVDRTLAAWPGSNVSKQLTFATSTFKLKLGPLSGSSPKVIAHLFISQVSVSIPNRIFSSNQAVKRASFF